MAVFLAKGSRIEHYNIEKRLGAGAEGTTYLALNGRGENVALKQLSLSVSDPANAETLARSLRLEKVTGKRHPNVCETLEVFVHEDLLYIAMEYVEGESLEDLLSASGPLRLASFTTIFAGLLEGLIWLDSLAIVHRDIKPGNIIVWPDGRGNYRAKFIDLGIALHRLMSRVSHMGGMGVGTYEYAPLEVVLPDGAEIDGRSDLYSLGATAFHALTGHLPFEGFSGDGFFRRLMDPARPSIRSLVPGLPEALDHFIQRLMAREPGNRPKDAEEARREFQDLLTSLGESAPVTYGAAGSPAPGPPVLLICSGPFKGKSIAVPRHGLALGRGLLNPEDFLLSRFHVRAALRRRGIFLRDLGSRNGLLLRGRRLRNAVLRPGEDVTVGATKLICSKP